MTFQYDREVDALDITIAEGIVARTVEVDRGTLVDLDAAGNLVAIEVIRPTRRWPLDEILAAYDLAESDAAVLRELWSDNKPYPFAEPARLAYA